MKGDFIYILLIFLIASYAAIIFSGLTDLATVLKILSILVLALLLGLRIDFKKLLFNQIKEGVIKAFSLFSISLFTMLIVISTGGILSPFLIVIHVVTIGLAFLVTFPTALAYLFSSLIAIFSQCYLVNHAGLLETNPALLIIQLASIAGLIPLSFIISKKYHLKSEAADSLFSELSVSKNTDDVIGENIQEGIVTIDRKLAITRINKTSENILGHSSSDVIGKNFFQVFILKDEHGNPITLESFPIKNLLAKPSVFSETNITIKKADGTDEHIDFKFSSIVGSQGSIEAFLFVFVPKKQESHDSSTNKILRGSFARFTNLLEQASDDPSINSRRMVHYFKDLELLYQISAGEIPGLLSNIDVGDVVRKTISQTSKLAMEYNVSLINSATLSPPMPIKTNRIVFEEAIKKIVELAIFTSAESPERMTIVSVGLSEENIFVFVKASLYEDFPWLDAGELVKPHFGKLSAYKRLSQASGLEGYLADQLLKEKGIEGGITGTKSVNGVNNPGLILTIILPYKH